MTGDETPRTSCGWMESNCSCGWIEYAPGDFRMYFIFDDGRQFAGGDTYGSPEEVMAAIKELSAQLGMEYQDLQ